METFYLLHLSDPFDGVRGNAFQTHEGGSSLNRFSGGRRANELMSSKRRTSANGKPELFELPGRYCIPNALIIDETVCLTISFSRSSD